MLEKTLENPLDSKKIKPVNPKGNQPELFIGRTDAEAEASILWPPDASSQFIRKDPDSGKDWRKEEKGMRGQRLNGITDSVDMSLSKLQEIVKDRESWHAAVHRVTKSRTWLRDWTSTTKWQPTPVSLPGKPHRQRSLVGYSPWGHRKSDTTERLTHTQVNSCSYCITELLYKARIPKGLNY